MGEQMNWSYIGRETEEGRKHPVGTVVCAVVDDPERKRETAKLVAKWMRDGLTIERVPVEWVRRHLLTINPYQPTTEQGG